MLESLDTDACKAIPIVLNRLKTKQQQFLDKRKTLLKEWNDICMKKWSKSLDHQLFNFKAREKKNVNIKNF